MQKQLNPQLFGMQTSQRGPHFAPTAQNPGMDTQSQNRGDQSQALLQIEEKIERNQRQMQELQGQLSQVAFHTEENFKATRQKAERQQTILTKIEHDQEALTIETSQKIHFLQHKHAEQKKLEDSVQHLIDRQNNLLKGYEVRLNQMQKLLADKEAQMLTTLAALNEAKLELQKLKRSY